MLYNILFVLDTILFLFIVSSIFSYKEDKKLSKFHICIIFYTVIHTLCLFKHLFSKILY
jgi:hypothetical protein